MLISGKEKLERMRDGRAIYIGAERVDDVTRHGAFRNAARTIADLYDFKADRIGATYSRSRRTASATACHGCAAAPARTLFAACAP
jgi:aromatic ring hydroxylase